MKMSRLCLAVAALVVSFEANAVLFQPVPLIGSNFFSKSDSVEKAERGEMVGMKEVQAFYNKASREDRNKVIAMIAANGGIDRKSFNEIRSKHVAKGDLIEKIDYLKKNGHPSVVSVLNKELKANGKISVAYINNLYERDGVIKFLETSRPKAVAHAVKKPVVNVASHAKQRLASATNQHPRKG